MALVLVVRVVLFWKADQLSCPRGFLGAVVRGEGEYHCSLRAGAHRQTSAQSIFSVDFFDNGLHGYKCFFSSDFHLTLCFVHSFKCRKYIVMSHAVWTHFEWERVSKCLTGTIFTDSLQIVATNLLKRTIKII